MKTAFLALALVSQPVLAEVAGDRFFIGTSAFTLVNLIPDMEAPPRFAQLNLGYQLSKWDVLSVEFITWRYYAPLGAPVAEASKSENKYPGHTDGVGAGLAYQRFLWRGLYSALHATLLRQSYADTNGVSLGTGTQLFMTFRLGYHLEFGSFFVEPSFAMTRWPINSGQPASFQEQERRWSAYAFEPGLHVGWMF